MNRNTKKTHQMLWTLAGAPIGTMLGIAVALVVTPYILRNLGGKMAADENFYPNRDSVAVCLCKDLRNSVGNYDCATDIVSLKYILDEIVVHELKHAHNAVVFPNGINSIANELSARCGEILGATEQLCRVRRIVRDTSELQITKVRIDEDGTQHSTYTRMSDGMQYNITAQPKFNINTSGGTILPRVVDYYIPNLEQRTIDDIVTRGLALWDADKDCYKNMYMYDWLRYGCVVLTDADLEKLFMFRINGAPHSLFAECRPELRNCLRDVCNGISMKYAWQRRKQRER